MSETSASIAGGQLRAFIERVERLEEEIKALNADKSEVYKEAKGFGFDVPTIKRVISARKLDVAERDERDTLFDLYWSAVEQPSRVHVHIREKDKFNPSKGESDAKSAEAAAENHCDLIDGRRQALKGAEHQPHHDQATNEAPAESAADEISATIPEDDVPAFLKKPSKPLRPHCQNPDECAGVGHKHCYVCRKAAGLVEAAA